MKRNIQLKNLPLETNNTYMTIAQGLKEKNKVVTKLSKLYTRFQQNNSVATDAKRVYEPKKLWEEILVEEVKLVSLKTSIHKASEPVRSDIFTQSELKNRISQLRRVSTQSGTVRDRYSHGENPVIFDAVFGAEWIDTSVEELEKQIETIQEKLDSFNHNTQI
jgi:hypothetical protein